MKNFLFVAIAVFTASIFTSSTTFAESGKTYGLKAGQKAPPIVMKDIEGKSFELKNEIKKGPVVLVFYRGGWCPYCNIQLRSLQRELAPKLVEHNAQIVAISVDTATEAAKTQKNESLNFRVLSDPKALILDRYNVQFKVPEDLVHKYKSEYKIDLEGASGQTHHIIAVPAVFVIGSDGRIEFAYADENYKVRADKDEILKTVERISSSKSKKAG